MSDDPMRMVRRNKLVGMWAAKKLGLVGESAKAYSTELAMGTIDFKRSNVLAIVCQDFVTAGIVHSDTEILEVMEKCWLQAAGTTRSKNSSDSALLQIARNLVSR